MCPHDEVTKQHLYDELQSNDSSGESEEFHIPSIDKDLPYTVAKFERRIIDHFYKKSNYNLERTAKLLGVHRTTIMRKLRNDEKN